jgi:uncharacterized membrane protein
MRALFEKLKDVAIAGFCLLLPVYIVLIIFGKVWVSLSSVGARVAAMFGMKSILGVGGSTVVSSLLLISSWIACGLLVRFAFVVDLNRKLEGWLAQYIPGYGNYKAMAEEKLQGKAKALPYTSALIKLHEYWQPAYVIEQDGEGSFVVFLPGAPDTTAGSVLLARSDQVRLLSSVTANQLDASLKNIGKGLFSQYGIDAR